MCCTIITLLYIFYQYCGLDRSFQWINKNENIILFDINCSLSVQSTKNSSCSQTKNQWVYLINSNINSNVLISLLSKYCISIQYMQTVLSTMYL